MRSSLRRLSFWLAVLACRLLRVRFLHNPVYPPSLTRIGHLCSEPDCFVKEGILGLRKWCIGVILIERARAANSCVLDYWRQRLWVVSKPFWVRLLKPLSEVPALQFHTDPYVTAMNDTATFSAIQAEYAGRPPLLKLTRRHQKEGAELLRRLGVPEGAWFVIVHCREGGYDSNDPFHRGRNATLEAYFPAMRAIVERGGWCVRMGDPTMTPLPAMPGVIDYAHSPLRSPEMDVFLCAEARFLLGSASGLCVLASVFGTPCAIANQSLPFVAYQYGTADLFIPKLIRALSGGHLTLPEILGGPLGGARFSHCLELARVEPECNDPDDIRDLALEMLAELDGAFVETDEDRRLQTACRALLKPGHYTFGTASRVGRTFLRKHRWLLEAPREPKADYIAACCGTRECPCLREGPTWAAQQLSLRKGAA